MNTLRTSWSTRNVTRQLPVIPMKESPSRLITSGDLIIDEQSREVARNGNVIELTKTEFDLLVILATHPRQVFTSRQLFQSVWSSHYFEADHVIETHISRLRRKLGESGHHPRYIHTVRGVGYRFEPQPDSTPPSVPGRGRYHVRLTPELTIDDIDAGLAALLGIDHQKSLGRPFAGLLSGLINLDQMVFDTRLVRNGSGTLVRIDLRVWPTGQPVPDNATYAPAPNWRDHATGSSL